MQKLVACLVVFRGPNLWTFSYLKIRIHILLSSSFFIFGLKDITKLSNVMMFLFDSQLKSASLACLQESERARQDNGQNKNKFELANS